MARSWIARVLLGGGRSPGPGAAARAEVADEAGVMGGARAERDDAVAGGGAATEADVAMMGRALELAREAAALGEVPVGAVVYETATGRIVGEGFNRREIDRDPSAHAELLAIRAAARAVGDWRLGACTLVVTLEPCAMCAGLIVNARVGRVVYGAADPKAGAAASLYRLTMDPRLNHRVEPIGGVMGEACGAILREFFRRLRRE